MLIYGRDAVHNCLKEEPIGFSDQCAQCWTEDIFCARSHWAFIFLQSNMINTVSNFQVNDDTITAATCEEAMCELAFVPCSGANRRRMNITSTIARPGRQLCSNSSGCVEAKKTRGRLIFIFHDINGVGYK